VVKVIAEALENQSSAYTTKLSNRRCCTAGLFLSGGTKPGEEKEASSEAEVSERKRSVMRGVF
jgi:hypothetical protein